MESPPQYPGAPKKSKTGLVIGIIALAVVLCCCGCLGVGGYFFKNALKGGTGLVGCSAAMGMERAALLTYAEKHGGKLPAARTWQDDVKPYLKRDKDLDDPNMPFKIPGANDDFCDKEGGTTIALNAAVAGKKLDAIKDKSDTIALFEVKGRGRNRSAPWSEPSFASSPEFIMGKRRGWIRIPLEGAAVFKGQNGQTTNAPTSGQSSVNFGD